MPNPDYSKVVPRRGLNDRRCPRCKSADERSGHPMKHPEHKWGPCEIRDLGGEVCGCEVSEVWRPDAQ